VQVAAFYPVVCLYFPPSVLVSKEPSLVQKNPLSAAGVESSIYRLEGNELLLHMGSRAAPRLVRQWARLVRRDSPGFSSSKGVGLQVLAEHARRQN